MEGYTMTTAVSEKELLEMDAQIEKDLKTKVTLEIQTDELKKLIGKVERSTAKTSTIEVMQGIYFFASEKKITVRAQNSDYGAEATVNRDEKAENFTFLAGKPGGAVLMDKRLSSMINSLPRKKTTVTITDGSVRLESGNRFFDVVSLPIGQFPKFPLLEESTALELSPDVLNRMYEKTVFAAAASESRPILTGVRHQIAGNVFNVTATDSHRLAQSYHEFEAEIAEIEKVIPATTLQEVMKHLKATSKVKIHFMNSSVIFEMDGVMLNTRILADKYPDVSKLVPAGCNTEVQFRVRELKSLIEGALIVNPTDAAKFKIKTKDKQARLITREQQKSHFQEDIVPVAGEGPDIQFGVNAKYVLDALKHQSLDATVKMQFLDKGKPFVIRLVNGDDRNLDLILPVRVSDSDMQADVVIKDFKADMQTQMDIVEEEAEKVE
jgi:DNA polymerase III subunit beta